MQARDLILALLRELETSPSDILAAEVVAGLDLDGLAAAGARRHLNDALLELMAFKGTLLALRR